MREGMELRDLYAEVKRREQAAADYLRPTKQLQFVADWNGQLEKAVADALSPSRELVSLGAGHDVANLAWRQALAATPGPGRNGTALAKPKAPEHGLLIPGVGTLPLSGLANDQLGQHLGIPGQFYDRLGAELPLSLQNLVNDMMQARPITEGRMVRTLDGKVRAFLSDKYRPLDYWDLVQFLLPLFAPRPTAFNWKGERVTINPILGPDGQPIKCKFPSVNITDTKLYLKITCLSFTVDVKVGQTVRAGVIIEDSEVGLGLIAVYPFYEVLQCTNGAVLTQFGYTKRHVGGRRSNLVNFAGGNGNDGTGPGRGYDGELSDATQRAKDKATFLEMADRVSQTLTEATFDAMLDPIRRAMGENITGKPAASVDMVGRKLGLGEAEADGVLEYLLTGNDLTQWGLSNAVTRYSQDVESYDRATELEKMGGDIITLAPSEWKEIASATTVRKRGN